MKLKLPFKVKINYLTLNNNKFDGKAEFHGKDYAISIHTHNNEKIIKIPFPVIGITDDEILVRLSGASGVYVEDRIKFKGKFKRIEINSDTIFHEIKNNQIKFDVLEIFVK